MSVVPRILMIFVSLFKCESNIGGQMYKGSPVGICHVERGKTLFRQSCFLIYPLAHGNTNCFLHTSFRPKWSRTGCTAISVSAARSPKQPRTSTFSRVCFEIYISVGNYFVFLSLVKNMKRMFLPIQNTMDTSNILSTLITTKEGSEVEKQNLHDNYEQFYFNIEWCLNSIAYITVVGGLGNILSFMQKGFHKNVYVGFFMSILALADTGK